MSGGGGGVTGAIPLPPPIAAELGLGVPRVPLLWLLQRFNVFDNRHTLIMA